MDKINILKLNLNKAIEDDGLGSKKVLNISRQLDELITEHCKNMLRQEKRQEDIKKANI